VPPEIHVFRVGTLQEGVLEHLLTGSIRVLYMVHVEEAGWDGGAIGYLLKGLQKGPSKRVPNRVPGPVINPPDVCTQVCTIVHMRIT